MKQWLGALGAVAVVGLSGCINHVDRPLRPVVANRVFVPVSGDPPRADTTVIVGRDWGLFGGGCSSRLYVDGKLAVQLEQGEQVSLPLVGGDHQLTLHTSGACDPVDQTVQMQGAAGQSLGYRISARGTALQPVARSS